MRLHLGLRFVLCTATFCCHNLVSWHKNKQINFFNDNRKGINRIGNITGQSFCFKRTLLKITVARAITFHAKCQLCAELYVICLFVVLNNSLASFVERKKKLAIMGERPVC
jgi:hypothetical protein